MPSERTDLHKNSNAEASSSLVHKALSGSKAHLLHHIKVEHESEHFVDIGACFNQPWGQEK